MIAVIGPVVIDISRLLAFDGEVVRDASDTDYLYTKIKFAFEGVIAIGAQTWTVTYDPIVGPIPVRTPNASGSAINSVVALRHALAQRLPICIFEPPLVRGGQPQVLLYSNVPDVANGPKPLLYSVDAIHGSGLTAFVKYAAEVAINDCPIYGNQSTYLGLLGAGGVPFLLSNRWQTGVSYDQDNECATYSLTGAATFRRDGLDQFFSISPDQFRGNILPPVPVNCKRYIDDISVAPDGLTLRYAIRDVEQIRNYLDYDVDGFYPDPDLANPQGPPRGVAKVDVLVEKSYGQPGLSKLVDYALKAFTDVNFANPISSNGGDVFGGQQAAKDGVKTGVNIALGIYKTADSLIPFYTESATARVQLTRTGKMETAQRLALALVSGALNYGNGQGFLDKAFGMGVPNDPTNVVILPPLTVSYKYSPTDGWFQASMMIERSGLMDFISTGTVGGIGTMMQGISDDIVGGQIPYSLASLAGLLGAAPQKMLDLIKNVAGGWGRQLQINALLPRDKQAFFPNANEQDVLQLLQEFGVFGIETLQYKLLVTNRAASVVGPNGDFYSRSPSDVFLRAAAVLLRPCAIPQPATTYVLPQTTPSTAIPVVPGVPIPIGIPIANPPPLLGKPLPKVPQDLINQWGQVPADIKGFFDPNGLIK